MSSFANDPQKSRLSQLWAAALNSDLVSVDDPRILRQLSLHHESAPLLGHVLLDTLEEAGFAPGDIDSLGSCSDSANLVGLCVLFAATSRGLEIDSFQMESETSSALNLVGPSVDGRHLALVIDGADLMQIRSAVNACQQAGGKVVTLVQLLDGVAAGSESADRPELTSLEIPVVTLFSISDVVAA